MRGSFLRMSSLVASVAAGAMLLAGCASVAFEEGTSRLDDRALVFGRVLLDRDGERDVISTFASSVVIRNIESASEPGMVTQPFDRDGGFSWALPPGRYQVSFVLHQHADGVKSYGFSLPSAGTAYYFGDLTFSGTKRFDTIGGVNMRNVEPRFRDAYETASEELRRRNPQLRSIPVERLVVRDMASAQHRTSLYGEALSAGRPCCSGFSQMTYRPLAIGKSTSHAIGPDSPLFDFPNGRSRFAAWELPRLGVPYTIAIRSVVTPSGLPGRFHVFSPAVLLLDADFNVVSKHEGDGFAAVPATVLPPRAASLDGEIKVAADKASARFLVVYTTKALVESIRTTSIPEVLPIAGGALPGGGRIPVGMEPTISGVIQVVVRPN